MDEKIGLLFGNLGQEKTELVKKWTHLPVVEIKLVDHVSDEEMYNLVTDMSVNMDLIDIIMEGSDGSE